LKLRSNYFGFAEISPVQTSPSTPDPTSPDPFLARRHRQVRQFLFGLDYGVDALFESGRGEEAMHLDIALLPDPESTVGSRFDSRFLRLVIPATIIELLRWERQSYEIRDFWVG